MHSIQKITTSQSASSPKDANPEGRPQRDLDTYITLKHALQQRLFDVLLNWDLFSNP